MPVRHMRPLALDRAPKTGFKACPNELNQYAGVVPTAEIAGVRTCTQLRVRHGPLPPLSTQVQRRRGSVVQVQLAQDGALVKRGRRAATRSKLRRGVLLLDCGRRHVAVAATPLEVKLVALGELDRGERRLPAVLDVDARSVAP
eukprot:CAMPEP_0195566726 /NCGR_PEP_ID=MMETSP0814-20130614/1234_1 /TAXON_ID=97485 /ORGANISM="Prymnesium parvum, Strain Texoma1" /LENGTH=143 /DNA_ID=CAMNT_0040701879 /DNA_START=278 /DNA_END=709 /DNA_ORIENTATION=+